MNEIPNVPRHIGIIMDGNGRWAKRRGLPRKQGHKQGGKRVEKTVEYAFKKGIKAISLYAFSSENWNRPKEEVQSIFSLIGDFLTTHVKKLIDSGVRLIVSGDITKLPPDLQAGILRDMQLTKENTKGILNIAINYGGRQDICRAVNELIERGERVTEQSLELTLSSGVLPPLDLIIRTGGEQRLSNFMLYEASYSELYFTDCLWPDFDEVQFDLAIENYQGRKRNFGGITENA